LVEFFGIELWWLEKKGEGKKKGGWGGA